MSLNFYRAPASSRRRSSTSSRSWAGRCRDEREEFTLQEFVDTFTLERISLGGPVFDLAKLTWLNGKYLRRLSPPELLGRLRGGPLSDARLIEVLPLVQERIDTLEGFFGYAGFFFTGEVDYEDGRARRASSPRDARPRDAEAAAGPRRGAARPAARLAQGGARAGDPGLRGESRLAGAELFMTLRVATTGRAASPPLFETLAVLGKETCRRRLRRAAEVLKTGVAGN